MALCKGINRKGKRCGSSPLSGSLYCSAHQKQAPKPAIKRPWYKHPVFVVSISLLGICLTLYYGQSGDKGQNELKTNINEMNTLIKGMREYENDYTLLQNYPLGYSLFAIDYKRNIIPNYSKSNTSIQVDWSTGQIESITPENISIRVPELIYNSKNLKNRKLSGNVITFERTPGKIQPYATFIDENKIDVVIEPLKNFPEGFVCLIGVKEESEPNK